MLVWPGFWNGYPLVFADTGTYLGQALLVFMGWDRPPFYSAFLFATHWRLTLWVPMFAQGLIVAHLLALVLRTLGRPSPWLLLSAAFGLSVLTGLPWVAAQLIPDVFTGVVVLALWLLGFRASRLSPGERLYVMLLAAGSIAFHQSHLPLALGLAACGAALLLAWRGIRPALEGTARMAFPAVLAAVALVAVNLAGHGRASLSPFGSVFLATRLIYDGPAMAMLRRTCPEAGWRICPVLDRLGPHHNFFLWEPGSPLWTELGGAEGLGRRGLGHRGRHACARRRGRSRSAWRRTPWSSSACSTPATGWSRGPACRGRSRTSPASSRGSWTASSAGGSSAGCCSRTPWPSRPCTGPRPCAASLALLVLPVVFRRRLGLPGVSLAVLVLAASLGNAAITGGLSGPAVRYQARLAWLFVFAPAAVLLAAPAADSPSPVSP